MAAEYRPTSQHLAGWNYPHGKVGGHWVLPIASMDVSNGFGRDIVMPVGQDENIVNGVNMGCDSDPGQLDGFAFLQAPGCQVFA